MVNRLTTVILCLTLCLVGITAPTASAASRFVSSDKTSLVLCLQQEYLMRDVYQNLFAKYPMLTTFRVVAADEVVMIATLKKVFAKYKVAVPADARVSAAQTMASGATSISIAHSIAINLEQSTATMMTQLLQRTDSQYVPSVVALIKTASLGSHTTAFTAEQASLASPSPPLAPPLAPIPAPAPTSQTLTGSGIPEASLGAIGDIYIDTASHNIYGPGIGADSLANTRIGGPDGTPGRTLSIRFRASTTSALTSINFYQQGGPGYAGGTGGSLKVSVQTDDGTSSHLPSGTILASQTVTCAYAVGDPGRLVTFSNPATLVAGNLYHMVFANADPAPATNYVSLNAAYVVTATTPRQPLFADTDWALLMMSVGHDWKARPEYTPIMSIAYANGQTAGMGYMERCYPDYSIDGIARVRETFTVADGDRTVSTVGVRLRRITGTGSLTLTVETSAGSIVGSATIPASSIPTGTYGSWVTAAFAAPFKLTTGSAYNFVLTTSSGTTYSVLPFRKGLEYDYLTGSYFKDGHAEQSSSGSTWVDVSTNRAQYDVQFYFANVTSAVYGPKTSTGWGLKSPLPNNQ
jgi:hypothetical protein